jgi:hypothetical protein
LISEFPYATVGLSHFSNDRSSDGYDKNRLQAGTVSGIIIFSGSQLKRGTISICTP